MNQRQRFYLTERTKAIVKPAIGFVPKGVQRTIPPYTVQELYDEIMAGKHPPKPSSVNKPLMAYYKNILDHLQFDTAVKEGQEFSDRQKYHEGGQLESVDTSEADDKWNRRAAAVVDFCMLSDGSQALMMLAQLAREVDEYTNPEQPRAEAAMEKTLKGFRRREGKGRLNLTREEKWNGE